MLRPPRLHAVIAGIALTAAVALPAGAQPWTTGSFDPPWASVAPTNVVTLTYNSSQSSAWNGQQLFNALVALNASQDLAIGPGTWLLPSSKLSFALVGTAANPVWIYAQNPAQRPVLMRTNAGSTQNILNVGETSAARFVGFRNLEITHQQPAPVGSTNIKLYDCANVWIDGCYIHDGGGVGIAANSRNTSFLYITRNEIARPGVAGSKGEGMYLGGNNGSVIISDSIVALNHVHDTAAADDGDGIELKQGAYRCWLVLNHVHDTKYPCLLAGGTGTQTSEINLIERNLLYRNQDNVMQVQGDAIVRNNIAIHTSAGGGAAFQSFAHQGPVRRLSVRHNTFVNPGRAANLSSWNGAASMEFANNACYSQTTDAIRFSGGSTGVTIAGNVVFGSVVGATSGFVTSTTGLADFASVTWTGTSVDVTPVVGSVLDNHGSAAFAELTDILGVARFVPADPGARESAFTALADTFGIPAATGGTQNLTFSGGAGLANLNYLVVGTTSGITPSQAVQTYEVPLVADGWFNTTLTAYNNPPLVNTLGTLDAAGSAPTGTAGPRLVFPPIAPMTFWHAFVIFDGTGTVRFVSNPVPLVAQ